MPHVKRAAEAFDEVLSREPVKPAVAVYKRMDLHEAVVKPDGYLVVVRGRGTDPVFGVIDEPADPTRHLVPIDAADVHVGPAVPARPPPHRPEHQAVELPQVAVVK